MSIYTAWEPKKKGERFVAYVRGYGMHKARGGPFKCTLPPTKNNPCVHAEDSEGFERQFKLNAFRLEPYKKSPPES